MGRGSGRYYSEHPGAVNEGGRRADHPTGLSLVLPKMQALMRHCVWGPRTLLGCVSLLPLLCSPCLVFGTSEADPDSVN